ncbi:MAG: SO_0444 family Cu/Zn efflux transporter [Deltaproteobacteria bacterium]|nr:SO_0444 family Cu/Zn efflux transporter [Deltaproteobacteria bacterium]
MSVLHLLAEILGASWRLLLDAAPYVLFGIVVAGLVKVFLDPASVAKHLGQGRVSSVFKAALLGVPLPLCSCGVLPAAASLKRQGANNGATTAFLISTPESGVDSMAITYALMDPLMTVARPAAALVTAVAAGVLENLVSPPPPKAVLHPDLSCPVDGCCSGQDCDPREHRRHHSWGEKLVAGLRYAFGELWGDLAGWFLAGILLAGIISALVPADLLTAYLGGGSGSMLLMLLMGIPIYICATASTPIAAALILKGVSPGAALVFLLAGPATNLTSLAVLQKVLGKRATLIYLACIAGFAVLSGLLLDQIYAALGISARAVVGQASELLPLWVRWPAVALVLGISARPVWRTVRRWLPGGREAVGSCACCAPEAPEGSAGPAPQSLDSLGPLGPSPSPGGAGGSGGCGCGSSHLGPLPAASPCCGSDHHH